MSRSVLVVDDEPGIIELASACLRRDGFDVRTATTGRRALDSVATQAPDLVVLDLMLPDLLRATGFRGGHRPPAGVRRRSRPADGPRHGSPR